MNQALQTVRLGDTGLKVSRLCLGTMPFGNQVEQETAHAILDRAFEAGIFFFDTADVYPVVPMVPKPELVGRSEEIIGHWLKGKRGQVVLATKLRGRMGPGANDAGLSRRHIMDAVDDSLRRLQTDYIDLYQVHSFDPETPLEETLRSLDDLVRSGKVRYIGCSNFAAWQLMKALGMCSHSGLSRFASVQARYNLFDRPIERELLPCCADQRVAVLPYSPLAAGLLTGKYGRSGPPTPDSRYVIFGRMSLITEPVLDALDALADLARSMAISMAQLALAWVLARPEVTAPIIGASRPAQLEETLAALDVKLGPEELTRCDEIAMIAEGRKPAGARV